MKYASLIGIAIGILFFSHCTHVDAAELTPFHVLAYNLGYFIGHIPIYLIENWKGTLAAIGCVYFIAVDIRKHREKQRQARKPPLA